MIKEIKVPKEVSTDTPGHIVNSVLTTNPISFSTKLFGDEGVLHMKPLNIVVKCNEKLVTKVLIDNGSSLNCPLETL